MRFITTKPLKSFLEVPQVLVHANEGRKASSAFADFAIESLAKQRFCK